MSAFQFFKAVLKHLALLEEIEIRNYGGLEDLRAFLRTLPAIDGYPAVTSVGIVRDAEGNAQDAFKSVRAAIAAAATAPGNTGLPERAVPLQPKAKTASMPSVSVFILPDCANPGMLEDVCLQSIREGPAAACVEEYFKCLSGRRVALPHNMSKARLHAFLASMPDPELLLGQAAHRGYFPWASPAFDPIKDFLRAL